MDASPQLRDQLRTLSIPKEQRPRGMAGPARRGAGFGKWVFLLLLTLGGLAAWRYWAEILPRLQSLAAATAGATGGSGQQAELRTLTIRAAPDAQAPPLLTASGKIVSDHRVQVVTKVSGQIIELRFEQGDRVTEGQVLARLEDVNYRARRDEAAALLERARATLAFEQFNLQRIARLFEQGRMTDTELAQARRTHDETAAEVAAGEAAVEFAEKALADAQVSAPISGVVLERNVEVGDFVAAEGGRGANANAQFGAIADMTKLRVEVDVSEIDIAKVRAGMPCVVTPDAYKDRRYDGAVLWIDPRANYAKGTVQAKVRILNPDEHLRVEGSAQVSFLSEPRGAGANDPTIWIPTTAYLGRSDDASAKVFVVDGERVREAAVTLGRRAGNLVEVTSGLRDGQVIAIDQLDELSDGRRVRVAPRSGGDAPRKE